MRYLFFFFCFFQTASVYASTVDDTKALLGRLVIMIQNGISAGEYVLVLLGLFFFTLGLIYLKNQKKNNYPIHYIGLVLFVGVILVKPMACSNIASRTLVNQTAEMDSRLDNIEASDADGTDFSFNGE